MRPLRLLTPAAFIVGAALLVTVPNAVAAQDNPTLTNVIPESTAVRLVATIKSIDAATREVVLEGRSGATIHLIAGPAVRLGLLKAGDTVEATYYRSVAFLVSGPQSSGGTPTDEDSVTAALARPVHAPGGVAVRTTKVSGIVVGLDLAAHTVDVTPTAGGPVYTIEVTDPARIAAMSHLKIGDTITAVVSEALAVNIKPAGSDDK